MSPNLLDLQSVFGHLTLCSPDCCLNCVPMLWSLFSCFLFTQVTDIEMSPNAMSCTTYNRQVPDCHQFQIKLRKLCRDNAHLKHMPPAQTERHCLNQYKACCKHTCMLKTHLHSENTPAWPYYCCASLTACIQVLALGACVWNSQIRALRCKEMSSPITCCSPPASF